MNADLATELAERFLASSAIDTAFSGRITGPGDLEDLARPCLVVDCRRNGDATITAYVRGTPQDARAKLSPILAFVDEDRELVTAYSDGFRAPNSERESMAVLVVRRRAQLRAA